MTADPDDRDLRAAEYVLGSLSAPERAAMALEITVDPAARAAVRDWERRLAPLALAAPEVDPGPGLWPAIAAALPERPSVAAANDNRVRDLARSLRLWRGVAAGAGALAAGLALYIAAGPGRPDAARYVAVVNRAGEAPALIVSIDTAAGIARVRPVGAETPAGRSLELWYVGAGQPPRSLGVIGAQAKRLPLPAGAERAKLADGLFAVSVEPPGGSPTGTATGPVVYSGKLIED